MLTDLSRKAKDQSERQKLLTQRGQLLEWEKRQQEDVRRSEANAQRRKEQRERVKRGGKAFSLKKSDQRTIELVEKYQQMKKDGVDVDKFIAKKRRRLDNPYKGMVPKQRRSASSDP